MMLYNIKKPKYLQKSDKLKEQSSPQEEPKYWRQEVDQNKPNVLKVLANFISFFFYFYSTSVNIWIRKLCALFSFHSTSKRINLGIELEACAGLFEYYYL